MTKTQVVNRSDWLRIHWRDRLELRLDYFRHRNTHELVVSPYSPSGQMLVFDMAAFDSQINFT